jgi:hypothetical protein
MKKYLLFALLLGFISNNVVVAQSGNDPLATEEAAPVSGPKMEFESPNVDYGTIEQHSEPLRSLSFTNTGTEPLIIKNARGSCGCTVPIWPKEPIMPGETSKIDIRYATNRLGKINKKVTITTNEGGEPHVIKVLGKVLKPEAEDAVPAAAPSIIKGNGKG